ncbi:MAG: ATP-dependent protease ATPase subunit HslU [Thermomicrobiales bacterium]|nr:ATP-dependent protease ATPase subunit HslU [Thermomicrobiales bacterium]
MENLTPRQIVAELDRYVIGQADAKRAVAVALRNRYRRQQLPDELRGEVVPKNILMMGPTGVGKTEIARRVARIVDAPFVKVEATRFTEVGYVGRDVESIVRDLVEVAIDMLHGRRLELVRDAAASAARQRLLDILAEQLLDQRAQPGPTPNAAAARGKRASTVRRRELEQNRLVELLDADALDDETVVIDVEETWEDPGYDEFGPLHPDDVYDALPMFFGDGFSPARRRRQRVSVREARRILAQQEEDRLIDWESVIESAVRRVENAGVVFIDEIDKTINAEGEYAGSVSGEGVQRDLLPIVEGSVVMTRYGPVRTDHILFIAAGSFHATRPADLIPELQGRFPIRVELQSLSEDDLYTILCEPENALTKQSVAMLATEGVELLFEEDALREMARLATLVNQTAEDIGARRLHTIIERVIEDISFEAPERQGELIVVDAAFVVERIGEVAADEDLSSYIL